MGWSPKITVDQLQRKKVNRSGGRRRKSVGFSSSISTTKANRIFINNGYITMLSHKL